MQRIKTQVLGNRCSIKNAFWSFLDYGFNAASKTVNLGLNAAFNIEILINLIKIKLEFFKSKKFIKKLLKSQC